PSFIFQDPRTDARPGMTPTLTNEQEGSRHVAHHQPSPLAHYPVHQRCPARAVAGEPALPGTCRGGLPAAPAGQRLAAATAVTARRRKGFPAAPQAALPRPV